jgi:hypothetical protein
VACLTAHSSVVPGVKEQRLQLFGASLCGSSLPALNPLRRGGRLLWRGRLDDGVCRSGRQTLAFQSFAGKVLAKLAVVHGPQFTYGRGPVHASTGLSLAIVQRAGWIGKRRMNSSNCSSVKSLPLPSRWMISVREPSGPSVSVHVDRLRFVDLQMELITTRNGSGAAEHLCPHPRSRSGRRLLRRLKWQNDRG